MANPRILIIGAGPVGVTLAIALRHFGANDVLVVDQRESRNSRSQLSKAGVQHAGSLEIWRILGFAEEMISSGTPLFKAHFAAGSTFLELGPDVLGVKYSHSLAIPQAVTEGMLLVEAEKRGVQFAWGLVFDGLHQEPNQVIANFKIASNSRNAEQNASSRQITTSWLVGCDGNRSKVRDATGLSLETIAPSYGAVGWLADGYVNPGSPYLVRGSHPDAGTCLFATNGDGTHRVIGVVKTADKTDSKRPAPPSEEKVCELARLAFGEDFGFHDMTWSSTFSSAGKCASSFRAGRVFLAGDAAHQFFPVGGQGMNTGIHDALNLGWKIGLVETTDRLSSEAVERLLDSYSKERISAANAVIRNVAIQSQFLVQDSPPLWDFLSETLHDGAQNRVWARRFAGFGDPVEPYQSRYDVACEQAKKLVGSRLTHLSPEVMGLIDDQAEPMILLLLNDRQASTLSRALAEIAVLWKGLVTSVEVGTEGNGDVWQGVLAALVRPDLRIAWVGQSSTDVQAQSASLESCLVSWFGDHEQVE